jgi:hypothetical protein
MLWLLLFRGDRQAFRRWFAAPARWWERVLAATASAVVFAVLGLVVRLIVAPLPLLPLNELFLTILAWSGGGALTGMLLALLFPKTLLCIVYPFSSLLDVEVADTEVGEVEIDSKPR